jgi:hypothetical protein
MTTGVPWGLSLFVLSLSPFACASRSGPGLNTSEEASMASADTVLEGLENETREARKGLWADPQTVPPWELRKRKSRE